MSSRRVILALTGGLVALAGVQAAEFRSERIHGFGARANRINVLMVGDGWTEGQIESGAYADYCRRLVGGLLADAPFAQYANLLQVTRVDVPSHQSGTSHEHGDRTVNNYFGTYFPAERDKTGKSIRDYRGVWFRDRARSIRLLQEVNPLIPRQVVVVVINDPAYGGAASFAGPSATGYCTLTTSPDSPSVFGHELGHALMNLGDEYDAGASAPPEREPLEANVTLEGDPRWAKWSRWIQAEAPGIGLYEGAAYTQRGVYRPKETCAMRAVGARMCEVCVERTIQRLYENVSLVDAVEPARRTIRLEGPTDLSLKVYTVAASDADLQGEWFLDGRSVGGTSHRSGHGPVFELGLTAGLLPAGHHSVRFVVRDRLAVFGRFARAATLRAHRPNARYWRIVVRDPGRLPLLTPAPQSTAAGPDAQPTTRPTASP